MTDSTDDRRIKRLDQLTADERAEYDQWLAERPPFIRAQLDRHPPGMCYRYESRGHYAIASFGEDGTVTLLHGADSFLPGIGVFGVPSVELERCGCGRYEVADADTAGRVAEKLHAEGAAMREARHPGGGTIIGVDSDDPCTWSPGPNTRRIHEPTRRRVRRDRIYTNRIARAERATRNTYRFRPPSSATFVDRDLKPIDGYTWGALFENPNYRQVAWTDFGCGFSVSTVWMGHAPTWYGRPRVFETYAKWPGFGGTIELSYGTERHARITHYTLARVCAAAFRAYALAHGITPDPRDTPDQRARMLAELAARVALLDPARGDTRVEAVTS